LNYNPPERQTQIARRLRAFREHLKISRTAFALAIGIGSGRLAAYEAGRAPLRYEIFSAISKAFFLQPLWLATGETSPVGLEAFDDSEFASKINPKDHFIEVYDTVLSTSLQSKAYKANVQLRRDIQKMRDLKDFLDRLPPELSPKLLAQLEEMQHLLDELGDKMHAEKCSREDVSALVDKSADPIAKPPKSEKRMLTKITLKSKCESMKSPMQFLLSRLSQATRQRGKKTALAKLLRVPPPRISEWLRGTKEPGGEITLRLLEWVTAEEAQQQNAPSSVTSTARSKARSTETQYETEKTDPRRKYRGKSQ
jgi:transcriptional regulator with XRE-family HTH domain